MRLVDGTIEDALQAEDTETILKMLHVGVQVGGLYHKVVADHDIEERLVALESKRAGSRRVG
jgi:hypothetical protein